jgi:cytochrome P450
MADRLPLTMVAHLIGLPGQDVPRLLRWAYDSTEMLGGIVDAFLDEALRLESPFRGHHRHVVTDTTLGGVDLPAGSHLLLLWGSANRDPTAFENPDDIVLDRPHIRSHLAFGKGVHFCVGSALARMEALAATTAPLACTDHFSLAEDAETRWLPGLLVCRHSALPLHPGRANTVH